VPVTTHPGAAVPRLVVLAPEVIRGRQIELAADYLTVGREPTCDVCLDDPHVSRTHAALERRDGTVYIQDLGSSGGTFVNGNLAKSAELHQGDVVTFATVRARFEAAPSVSAETQAMPTQAAPPPARATVSPDWSGEPPGRTPRAERAPDGAAHAGPVRYEIGQQEAQVISNIGRDQYNAQVQQVIQRRDSFMREIAGTRTKARWLVWLGLLLSIAGFAMFAAADLNFLKQIASDVGSNSTAPPSDPFGRPIFGIPSGLLGWAIAAIGGLMLVIGIVLHIVATSRRKRVERDYPLPMPWPPNVPQGRAR
jgi:pSer/pThr/pTyr-binding forkhead associated (FHA) protein